MESIRPGFFSSQNNDFVFRPFLETRGFDDVCTAPKTVLVSDMDQLGDHGKSMGFKTLKIRGTSVRVAKDVRLEDLRQRWGKSVFLLCFVFFLQTIKLGKIIL